MELELQSWFRLLCTAETPQLPLWPLPPHLDSFTRALFFSQDRRHLFVTPRIKRIHRKWSNFWIQVRLLLSFWDLSIDVTSKFTPLVTWKLKYKHLPCQWCLLSCVKFWWVTILVIYWSRVEGTFEGKCAAGYPLYSPLLYILLYYIPTQHPHHAGVYLFSSIHLVRYTYNITIGKRIVSRDEYFSKVLWNLYVLYEPRRF
jgi:hypothetical protein